MLTEETFKKLHEMRLSVMAQALREQCDTTAFDGRFLKNVLVCWLTGNGLHGKAIS